MKEERPMKLIGILIIAILIIIHLFSIVFSILMDEYFYRLEEKNRKKKHEKQKQRYI